MKFLAQEQKQENDKITGKQMHLINKLLMKEIEKCYETLKIGDRLFIEFNPLWNEEILLNVEFDVFALTLYPSTPKNIASTLIDAIEKKKYKIILRERE